MSKLLLLALLFSRDTIITRLAPASLIEPAATPARYLSGPTVPIVLQIVNRSTRPLRNLILDWSLQENGAIVKKGKNVIAALPPNRKYTLRPGPHMPNDTMGETTLLLRYRSSPAGP